MELEWGEPPQDAFTVIPGGMYGDMAKELKKNREKWATVPRDFASEDSAKNTATRIRQGRVVAMPKGEFEAVSHETKVWVRYIGPAADEAPAEPTRPRLVSQPARTPSDANAQIRAWAKDQGMDVAGHGRLPRDVVDAYRAAMENGTGTS